MKSRLPTFTLFSLISVICFNAVHAESKNSSSPQLPEVIIKGGEKRGIEGEKPLVQMELNAWEPVQPILETEETLLKRQPDFIRSSRVGFVEYLANTRAIVPARMLLAKEPVTTFYPLREIFSSGPSETQELGKGWEIAISGREGESFRKFAGKSLPPATLPWDGRGTKGEMMQPGKNYSLIITYKNSARQSRNYIGKPFSFDGIVHQEPHGLVISLAVNALFKKKDEFSGKETITELGMALLEESADWIKRYYYNSPLKVEAVSKDQNMAQTRISEVATILESLLLRPAGEITTQTLPPQNGSERIDIIIINR